MQVLTTTRDGGSLVLEVPDGTELRRPATPVRAAAAKRRKPVKAAGTPAPEQQYPSAWSPVVKGAAKTSGVKGTGRKVGVR